MTEACGRHAQHCVTSSAGRSAEATSAKIGDVETANDTRKSAKTDLEEAKARHAAALQAETAECASGVGEKCKSKRQTTRDRRADVEVAEAKLREAPPERVANGGTKHAAAVFSIIVRATPDDIERALDLLEPFVKALFLEIATLVFLGIGLGHQRHAQPV